MKLYALPPSPNTVKVAALIHHLGLDVEIVPVDMTTGANKTPEYLEMNPNGLMPTLEDGDFHLWESNAILQYLAQKNPESGLYPTDIQGQADVTRWFQWNSAHMGAAIRPYMYERMVKPMMMGQPTDEEVVAKAEPDFKRFAGVLEGHLSKHDFLVGNKLSVADFAVAANLIYAGPARIPMGDFPKLQAFVQRIAGTDAWKKAIPQMPAAAARA